MRSSQLCVLTPCLPTSSSGFVRCLFGLSDFTTINWGQREVEMKGRHQIPTFATFFSIPVPPIGTEKTKSAVIRIHRLFPRFKKLELHNGKRRPRALNPHRRYRGNPLRVNSIAPDHIAGSTYVLEIFIE